MRSVLIRPTALGLPPCLDSSWLCMLAKDPTVHHSTNICVRKTYALHLQMFLLFEVLSHLLAHFNLTQK